MEINIKLTNLKEGYKDYLLHVLRHYTEKLSTVELFDILDVVHKDGVYKLEGLKTYKDIQAKQVVYFRSFTNLASLISFANGYSEGFVDGKKTQEG